MAANTTNSNDEVTRAIQNSRFNETVVLTVQEEERTSNSTSTREILLVPCLDDQNGGIIWNDLANTTSTLVEDRGIARHLRTKQWFFPMLNDARRNQLYQSAIQMAAKEAVQRLHASSSTDGSTSTIQVLDIGSGTGLLAMMAATSCQKALLEKEEAAAVDTTSTVTTTSSTNNVQVTSLEMSAAMSRLARLTIQDNHLQDTIKVQEQHSCQLPVPAPKFHLCVSELLESSLLQEGMLPALRDAWERLLHPNAVMVPQKARVYAQLVEGPFLAQYWGPHHSNSNAIGIRLGRTSNPNDFLLDGGARGGLMMPIHAEHWVSNDNDSNNENDNDTSPIHNDKLKPLSNPFQVLDFDFSRPGKLPGSQGRCLPTTVQPHSNGTVHALLLWWELDLFGDNCMYSTQVGKEPWQDHWHQCLFVFTNGGRNDDGDDQNTTTATTNGHDDNDASIHVSFGYPVQKDQPVQVMASHSDTNMWFSIVRQDDKEDDHDGNPSKRTKRQHPNDAATASSIDRVAEEEEPQQILPLSELHLQTTTVISPHRAWQLNDQRRQQFYRRAIRRALQQKGMSAKVLDLSDFSLCAMLAAVEGATRVWSLESSSGNIPLLSAEVAQLANGLPRNTGSNGAATAVFQILQCHAEQLSLELLSTNDQDDNNTPSSPQTPVEIVVGEIYYEMLEGWHLQEALNYFYLLRALKIRGIIAPTAISIPGYATIIGCAIECWNLKGAYSWCGDDGETSNICGFDHQQANQHGDRLHHYDLSLPMWEYDYKELSSHFEIARIPFDGNHVDDDDSNTRQTFDSRAPFPPGQKGTCHGVLFWVDYGFDSDRAETNGPQDVDNGCLSTLGRSYRQLLRLLASPFVLGSEEGTHEINCHFEFGRQEDLESYKLDLSVRKVSP